jgi:hypothetical protein
VPKKRENRNFGKLLPIPRASPSSFEQVVNELGLSPQGRKSSVALKDWVCRNKDHKHLPADLLKEWSFEVNGEL